MASINTWFRHVYLLPYQIIFSLLGTIVFCHLYSLPDLCTIAVPSATDSPIAVTVWTISSPRATICLHLVMSLAYSIVRHRKYEDIPLSVEWQSNFTLHIPVCIYTLASYLPHSFLYQRLFIVNQGPARWRFRMSDRRRLLPDRIL
jgi:hypothetical protein